MSIKARLDRLERNAPEYQADVDAWFADVTAQTLRAALELWPDSVVEGLTDSERRILSDNDPALFAEIDGQIVHA